MGDLTNDIEELKRTMSVLIEIEKRKLELELFKVTERNFHKLNPLPRNVNLHSNLLLYLKKNLNNV